MDQARDFHDSFDPRRVPEKAALRQLSRLQRRLAEKVAAHTEEALATVVSFDKATVDAAASAGITGGGIPLPEHILVLRAYTYRAAVPSTLGKIPVDLVTYVNREAESLRVFPSAYLMGQRLYPVNTYEAGGFYIKGDTNIQHGWEDLNGLDVLLVPTPAELQTPADLLTLPDSTHDGLVTMLAGWMAQRRGVLKEMPFLKEELQDAEETAIATLVGQDTTSTWTVTRK